MNADHSPFPGSAESPETIDDVTRSERSGMLEFLQQTIARDFEVDSASLNEGSRLNDFAIDSLGLIEIMFAVEEAFDITVPPDPPDARHPITTLGELVDYLDGLVRAQRGVADARPALP
ncbi:MAG: acyl carrier protein [Betaproteobacteria bacterium]